MCMKKIFALLISSTINISHLSFSLTVHVFYLKEMIIINRFNLNILSTKYKKWFFFPEMTEHIHLNWSTHFIFTLLFSVFFFFSFFISVFFAVRFVAFRSFIWPLNLLKIFLFILFLIQNTNNRHRMKKWPPNETKWMFWINFSPIQNNNFVRPSSLCLNKIHFTESKCGHVHVFVSFHFCWKFLCKKNFLILKLIQSSSTSWLRFHLKLLIWSKMTIFYSTESEK